MLGVMSPRMWSPAMNRRLGPVVERDVAEGMSRRVDDLQPVAGDLDHVAFVQGRVVDVAAAAEAGPGMAFEGLREFLGREAAAPEVHAHRAVLGPAAVGPAHCRRVDGAHRCRTAGPQQVRDQAVVIRVRRCVARKSVFPRSTPISSRARGEDLPALGAVHARVDDEEAVVLGEDVAVHFLERVSRQRHDDPVERIEDFLGDLVGHGRGG